MQYPIHPDSVENPVLDMLSSIIVESSNASMHLQWFASLTRKDWVEFFRELHLSLEEEERDRKRNRMPSGYSWMRRNLLGSDKSVIEQLLFIIAHMPPESQGFARQAMEDIVTLAKVCEHHKLKELLAGEWPDLSKT